MASFINSPAESGSTGSEPRQKTRTRRLIACNYCRTKKIRCMLPWSQQRTSWHMADSTGNGDNYNPCANCLDRGQVCVSRTIRRLRNSKQMNGTNDTAERLARVEALLQQVPLSSSTSILEISSILAPAETGGIDCASNSFTSAISRAPDKTNQASQIQTLSTAMLPCSNISSDQTRPKSLLSYDSLNLSPQPALQSDGQVVSEASLTAPAQQDYTTPLSLELGPDRNKPPDNSASTDLQGNVEDVLDEIRERSSIASSETVSSPS